MTDKKSQCERCKAKFDKYELKQHKKRKNYTHGTSSKPTYTIRCKFCGGVINKITKGES